MTNINRIIKLIGALCFLTGFVWSVFQHFTIEAWTKTSVSSQAGIVRNLEQSIFSKEELEKHVIEAVIDRAEKVQSPLIPAVLMFVGLIIMLFSKKPVSK